MSSRFVFFANKTTPFYWPTKLISSCRNCEKFDHPFRNPCAFQKSSRDKSVSDHVGEFRAYNCYYVNNALTKLMKNIGKYRGAFGATAESDGDPLARVNRHPAWKFFDMKISFLNYYYHQYHWLWIFEKITISQFRIRYRTWCGLQLYLRDFQTCFAS